MKKQNSIMNKRIYNGTYKLIIINIAMSNPVAFSGVLEGPPLRGVRLMVPGIVFLFILYPEKSNS